MLQEGGLAMLHAGYADGPTAAFNASVAVRGWLSAAAAAAAATAATAAALLPPPLL